LDIIFGFKKVIVKTFNSFYTEVLLHAKY